MKKTALLTLVLLAMSYPAMAKTHRAHHHVARTSHHANHHVARKPRDTEHFGARESHPQITCEMVRAYVAQVGLGQAMAMAQSAGITASEKERARQCLAKRI
jgi:hypothetical protein